MLPTCKNKKETTTIGIEREKAEDQQFDK